MPFNAAVHLVLIETAGNQRFIFDTNKLRENIGASELVCRAGVDYVLAAVAKVTGRPPLSVDDLGKPALNPPIEDGAAPVEVVAAASGKAIVLVRDPAVGRRLVTEVTMTALVEAPGLAVRGVVSEAAIPFTSAQEVHDELTRLIHRHEALGGTLPAPELRFPGLPVTAPCVRSGLPAEEITKEEGEALSAVSLAKQSAKKDGWQRIQDTLNNTIVDRREPLRFYEDVTALDNGGVSLNWVGLIHADGNGLGQVFLNFAVYTGKTARCYVETYRSFSRALDRCTVRAFRRALDGIAERNAAAGKGDAPLPVVPLVLGGDDLTVLCDGRIAIRLTAAFLRFFADETAACPDVTRVVGSGGLGACAGVALVKPAFPFHAGYQLAEDLLRSAKQGKTVLGGGAYTALDFHVLYDSADADLRRIRRLATRDGKGRLTVRPYVVTAPPGDALDDGARAWLAPRRWVWLEEAMAVMPPGDDRLPNSVLHHLREAAHEGPGVAHARLNAVLGRERQDAPSRARQAWPKLVGSGDGTSLFVDTPEGPAIRLLDALDLVGFWR
ncbi:MAG TPA: hypothetical protein VEB64_17810 [Azospirillaceae bacterium]|nr:hypothetical protein [Azospirillaceae bacterium]